MQVIAGFFGSGALAALPGYGAAFFRYFKKLARFTKLATSYLLLRSKVQRRVVHEGAILSFHNKEDALPFVVEPHG